MFSTELCRQMMAGLSGEERRQLGLEGYGVRDLRYLGQDTRAELQQDMDRFTTWKANLVVLGIPLMDVVQVSLH